MPKGFLWLNLRGGDAMKDQQKQVLWSATLDMLTCPECADLDGKVWGINEDRPEPPLHQNCRCCLISIPYAGWKPTQRGIIKTGK